MRCPAHSGAHCSGSLCCMDGQSLVARELEPSKMLRGDDAPASLAQACWVWVLAASETVAQAQLPTLQHVGGHLETGTAPPKGPRGAGRQAQVGTWRPSWRGCPAPQGSFRVGSGGARGGGPRGGAGRGRERAPPPRARLPPALPPAAALGTGIRASWAAGCAGGDARLGATARGRARRAPGATWAARGPGRCFASGSCSREAAPRGALGEPRSLHAGKGCPHPPHHLCALPARGWGQGLQAPPPPKLRASPGLGKGPGSPPHCQPGLGQEPWASPLSGRSSRPCGGTLLHVYGAGSPPTAFSTPHHFTSRAPGGGFPRGRKPPRLPPPSP